MLLSIEESIAHKKGNLCKICRKPANLRTKDHIWVCSRECWEGATKDLREDEK